MQGENPKEETENGESENKVLWKKVETKRDEVEEAGENSVKSRFINCSNGTTVIISRKMR